jgi:ectoine hydroxylase-related dioxygenase (phytanoyl-CoA dioxygenase family)
MTPRFDTEKFQRDGYFVVENILDNDLLLALRRAAIELGARQPERGGWNEHSCFRHPAFRRLLGRRPLVDLAGNLVGEDVQLLQLDLLRVHALGGAEDWHRDVERVFDETLCVSCAIYLQDTQNEAGALLAMPGSHRWKSSPTPACRGFRDRAVSIPVKAGAAIVHDSGLWHSAAPNSTATDCWALFPIFGPYWIKRRDLGSSHRLPVDLLHADDPLVRQLIGLGLRPGAPTYLGDSDVYNRRGDEGIDYPSCPGATTA